MLNENRLAERSIYELPCTEKVAQKGLAVYQTFNWLRLPSNCQNLLNSFMGRSTSIYGNRQFEMLNTNGHID